jgi:hypothetical protein
MKQIARKLTFPIRINDAGGPGDDHVYNAMFPAGAAVGINHAEMLKAAGLISTGLMRPERAVSIDHFIHFYNDPAVTVAGKIAILKSIVDAEKKSTLLKSREITWFDVLFKALIEGATKSNLDTIFDKVSIICFNYDRCIEEFLLRALMDYCGTRDRKVIAPIMAKLRIHHPYGTIGPLPWQVDWGGLAYGSEVQSAYLRTEYTQIKMFTEEQEDTIERNKMLSDWNEAQHIFFLGFAYHELNLKLFGKFARKVSLVGSAYKFSEPNREYIEKQMIGMIFLQGIAGYDFVNTTCELLMSDYYKMLTGA